MAKLSKADWVRSYREFLEFMMKNPGEFQWTEWIQAAEWLKLSPVPEYKELEINALQQSFDSLEESNRHWLQELYKR